MLFFSVFAIIAKYTIYTILLLNILSVLFRRSLFLLIVRPIVLVLTLLATYMLLPDCSLAYIVFLAGSLISVYYGVNKSDRIIDLSRFQRSYGFQVTFLSNILKIAGFLWGGFNIVFLD